ncbi:sesquipedalian-1 [Bombina bombina]|uniref:sesquipedalian-1 n=1 Tax=Bombina bombina TaxID=8345 RepID=UPI00235A9070|nr:sesquipedalian-1 [Bombina bombina]XP_053557686.1 sesquipedalian-1 [Bombina bombina]
MKLNERNLVFYATCKSPVDKSGFLFKKGDRNAAYHKRWFVLKGNMFFYFDNEESREPVGVIILEGCRVELCESTEEFSFAISFAYPKSRSYILAADSQSVMESWVKALSRANFEYIRLVVNELQKQLTDIKKTTTKTYDIQGSTETSETNSSMERQVLSSNLKETSVQQHYQKDNGTAIWDNYQVNLPNGYLQVNGPKDKDELGHPEVNLSGASLTPGSQSELVVDEACFSPEDTIDVADPLCFLKLHKLYGEEIRKVRIQWLENLEKQNVDPGE